MPDRHPISIINSVAPIRVCDNGGWTDTWFAGHGRIFNIGVYPYAEVQLAVFPDGDQQERIVINAENYGERYVVNPEQQWNKHPLLEAAIAYMRVPIRTCQSNTCETSVTNYTDNEDVLIERNFFSLEPGGKPTGMALIANIQGGDVTVRNNIVDGQGLDLSGAGSTTRLVTHAQNMGAGLNADRIHVLNNTFYSNAAGPRNLGLCDSSNVGTGHECHGNLVYAPNDTGNDGTTADPAGRPRATTCSRPPIRSSRRRRTGADDGRELRAREQQPREGRRRRLHRRHQLRQRARPGGALPTGRGEPRRGRARTGRDGVQRRGAAARRGLRQRRSSRPAKPATTATSSTATAATRLPRADVCGNGVRDGGEACDDGNLVAGDGCDATCTLDAVCGNGVATARRGLRRRQPRRPATAARATCARVARLRRRRRSSGSEACDDGNLVDGDGCSRDLHRRGRRVCGNGVRERGEACDDGNAVAGDGCRANCTARACGDGIRDPAEACDDGNLVGGDGCRPGCSIERCGDGIHDANEGCDDGNLVSGDACSSTCTVENDPAADAYWVDAGGAGYTGTDGNVWISDAAFVNGGRVATSSFDVRNTTNDSLYQTRRFGPASGTPLTFNFPVTGTGPYRVRLHFAEMEPGVLRGMRVFNVVAENAFTLKDVDVYRSAGPARPYVRDVYVNVDDGALTLRFEPTVGEPMISGVEIIRGDPPVATPRFVGR